MKMINLPMSENVQFTEEEKKRLQKSIDEEYGQKAEMYGATSPNNKDGNNMEELDASNEEATSYDYPMGVEEYQIPDYTDEPVDTDSSFLSAVEEEEEKENQLPAAECRMIIPKTSILREELKTAMDLQTGYQELVVLENQLAELRAEHNVVKDEVHRLGQIAENLVQENTEAVQKYVVERYTVENRVQDMNTMMRYEQRAGSAKKKTREFETLNRKLRKENTQILIDNKNLWAKRYEISRENEKKKLEWQLIQTHEVRAQEEIKRLDNIIWDSKEELQRVQGEISKTRYKNRKYFEEVDYLDGLLKKEKYIIPDCEHRIAEWERKEREARRRYESEERAASRARRDRKDMEYERKKEIPNMQRITREINAAKEELKRAQDLSTKRMAIEKARLKKRANAEYFRHSNGVPKKEDILKLVKILEDEDEEYLKSAEFIKANRLAQKGQRKVQDTISSLVQEYTTEDTKNEVEEEGEEPDNNNKINNSRINKNQINNTSTFADENKDKEEQKRRGYNNGSTSSSDSTLVVEWQDSQSDNVLEDKNKNDQENNEEMEDQSDNQQFWDSVDELDQTDMEEVIRQRSRSDSGYEAYGDEEFPGSPDTSTISQSVSSEEKKNQNLTDLSDQADQEYNRKESEEEQRDKETPDFKITSYTPSSIEHVETPHQTKQIVPKNRVVLDTPNVKDNIATMRKLFGESATESSSSDSSSEEDDGSKEERLIKQINKGELCIECKGYIDDAQRHGIDSCQGKRCRRRYHKSCWEKMAENIENIGWDRRLIFSCVEETTHDMIQIESQSNMETPYYCRLCNVNSKITKEELVQCSGCQLAVHNNCWKMAAYHKAREWGFEFCTISCLQTKSEIIIDRNLDIIGARIRFISKDQVEIVEKIQEEQDISIQDLKRVKIVIEDMLMIVEETEEDTNVDDLLKEYNKIQEERDEKKKNEIIIGMDISKIYSADDTLEEITERCVTRYREILDELYQNDKYLKGLYEGRDDIVCSICDDPTSVHVDHVDIQTCYGCTSPVHLSCWIEFLKHTKRPFPEEQPIIHGGVFCGYTCLDVYASYLGYWKRTREQKVHSIMNDKDNYKALIEKMPTYLEDINQRISRHLRIPGRVGCLMCGDEVSKPIEKCDYCSRKIHVECCRSALTSHARTFRRIPNLEGLYCSIYCIYKKNLTSAEWNNISDQEALVVANEQNKRFGLNAPLSMEKYVREKQLEKLNWARKLVAKDIRFQKEYQEMKRREEQEQDKIKKRFDIMREKEKLMEEDVQSAKLRQTQQNHSKKKNTEETKVIVEDNTSQPKKHIKRKVKSTSTKSKKNKRRKTEAERDKTKITPSAIKGSSSRITGKRKINEESGVKKNNPVKKIKITKTTKAKSGKDNQQEKKETPKQSKVQKNKQIKKLREEKEDTSKVSPKKTTPSEKKLSKTVDTKRNKAEKKKKVNESKAKMSTKTKGGKVCVATIVKKPNEKKPPTKGINRDYSKIPDPKVTSDIAAQVQWLQSEGITSDTQSKMRKTGLLMYRGLPYHKTPIEDSDWNGEQRYEFVKLCCTLPEVDARKKRHLSCWNCNGFYGNLTKAVRKHYALYVSAGFQCNAPCVQRARTSEEDQGLIKAQKGRDKIKQNCTLEAWAEAIRVEYGTKDNQKDILEVAKKK